MRLILRTWNLFSAVAGNAVLFFERRNPEALLQREKENLRDRIARFNDGLVSHAALSERLMTQVGRGEAEQADLTARIRALVNAGNKEAAARYAYQLQQVTTRLEEDRAELEAAEATYQNLVRTRDARVTEARENIEKLRRQIGDLKTQRAVADLEGMAAEMIGSMGASGDSFDRLREMVGEERENASARARVARGTIDASDLALKEAEQAAMNSQALDAFLENENGESPEPPRALPDLTQSDVPIPAPKPRAKRARK